VPIFLLFLVTHVFAILFALGSHVPEIGAAAGATLVDTRAATAQLGTFGVFILVMRAYSMGAGTYTGIEAVSNGLPILREPRVQTAKRTMRYMAASLAFMAAGLMIGYILFGVTKVAGKTLNAVLMGGSPRGGARRDSSSCWSPSSPRPCSSSLRPRRVFSTAPCPFQHVARPVAAQPVQPPERAPGDQERDRPHGRRGPGAADRQQGSVTFLIVLYAINVFITFCLSQAGMVRHWWKERKTFPRWKRKMLINGFGLILTSFILISQVILKFKEGGWITLLVTGSLVLVAIVVKRFYHGTGRRLARLDHLMTAVANAETAAPRSLRILQGSPTGCASIRKPRPR